MDKKDEALKLALETLKQIDEAMPFPVAKLAQKVIREALASEASEQPAQQEPHCYMDEYGNVHGGYEDWMGHEGGWFPVYTSPPIEATPLASQRSVKPWVGLTDIEIQDCFQQRSKDKNKERKLIADQIVKKILEKMQ